MPKPFFPDVTVAWLFVGALIAWTVAAAIYDTRNAIIPKWASLGALGTGIIANAIRGVLMESQGRPLWLMETGSAVTGALDGLLFALCGFLLGFVMFFVMWMLGVCGGGDVKLMAALGAWLGYVGIVLLMIVSTVVLVFWMIGKVLFGGLAPRSVHKTLNTIPTAANRERLAAQPAKPGKFRITFSFPACVATILVTFWLFRFELQLAQPKPAVARPQENAHVAHPVTPAY